MRLDDADTAHPQGAYGIPFGALSVASGLDVWQTCVLSLVVVASAAVTAALLRARLSHMNRRLD